MVDFYFSGACHSCDAYKPIIWQLEDEVNYSGKIVYDKSKPDGVNKKLLDVSRLHSFGWQEKISLRDGIEIAYNWFLENNKWK